MLKALTATCLLATLSMLLSCGKERKVSSDNRGTREEPLPIEVEKQTLSCEPGISCDYIAKILVMDGGKQRVCTGTLISPNTVMTSTSCLPAFLRSPEVECSKDVFLFFNNKNSSRPLRVGCQKVLQVSSLSGNNYALWRDDVAFLQIDRNLYWRKQLAIVREGLFDNNEIKQVSVEQIDQYQGIVRRQDCRVIFNSYVNPLASDVSSPNAIISGCDFKNGTSGAPLLDGKNRIHGVVSQEIDSALRTHILNNEVTESKTLKTISHATNFACAPTLYDDHQLNEVECLKNLSQVELDLGRKTLLDTDRLFSSVLKEVRRSIPQNSYIEFDVRLTPVKKEFVTEIYPVCFKDIASWIKKLRNVQVKKVESSTLKARFKKLINSDGRVVPFQTTSEKMDFAASFYPRNIENLGKSAVVIEEVANAHKPVFDDLTACAAY